MAEDIVVARLVTPLIADAKQFTKGLEKASQTAEGWAKKIGKVFAKGFKTVVLAAGAVSVAIGGISAVLGKLAVDAAPLSGISVAFEGMAQRTGVSLDALKKAAAGTVSEFDLMRQANIALTGAGEQLGKEFGEKLPILLESARAAARATGQDAGFLFESIVSGVKRASPMLIDNTGIVLKVGEANETLARQLGKTVEQLTAQEKSIAILNATTEAGAKLVEQFGSAELTTAEKAQRLTATFQNLRDQAGVALGPVLGNVAMRLADIGERILPPLISLIETKLAPALDLIVDAFGNTADAALDAGESMLQKFGSKAAETAEKALRWGIEVSTEFATGLVKGAAQALTAAMQFIGNLLSGWLSPGSPPKVAPQIDKWGVLTFEEYLKGFSKASFDLLEGVQKPLQSVLSSLVSAGKLGADASAKAFAGLSTELSKAITGFEKTGKVSTDIFAKLEKAGGKFGDELAELARRQFAVAKATREVAAAEENLAKARKENEKAQETVDALAEEFNELLRAGADPAILDAKRAEFDAAKDQLALSEEQIAAAEDEKAAAEEKIDPLQEQADLQQRLLDQLLQMEQASAKVDDAAKNIASSLSKGIGAALGETGGLQLPPIAPLDFSAVSESFTDAKESIFAKFEDLFAPVTKAWKEEIEPTLDDLVLAWGRFTAIVKEFWDKKVDPIVKKLEEFLPEDFVENLGEFAGTALIVAAGLGILLAALALLLNPITLLAAGIVFLISLWNEHGEQITTTVEQIGVILEFALNSVITTLKQLAFLITFGVLEAWTSLTTFLKTTFTTAVNAVKTGVIDPIAAAFTAVKNAIDNALAPIREFIEKIQSIPGLPDWMTPGSPPPLAFALQDISAAMRELNQMDLPEFSANIAALPNIGAGGDGSTTNNFFEQNVNTSAGIGAVTQGFEIQRSMVQAS